MTAKKIYRQVIVFLRHHSRMPTYRRNHLADRMLKKAFEKLETNGVKRVLLEVREGNNAAITLYKKYGFEQIGKRKNYYSNLYSLPIQP